MQALDTATQLTRFARRGAGTDAERRAAAWLAGQIRSGRRRATVQTFWCRPNGALATAWHVLAAIVGSLLAVHHAYLGGAIVLAALLCVALDAITGHSPGRRLTREHASQNVVSPARTEPAEPHARLIITANYDAGRAGLAYRNWLRAPAARLRRLTGPLSPGWTGWLVILMTWLVAVAVVRHGGTAGTPIGVVQLVPTAALVLALALALELAGAPFGPATADNGTGAGVAIALMRALDAAPPRRLAVELVLQGAGDAGMVGLRHHLRSRRGELRPASTIVLGIAAAGGGRPRWWVSDGPLVARRYAPRLRSLAAKAARPPANGAPAARPHRGRGTSPALPARTRGLPALTIGCLDGRGVAPHSHQAADTPENLDPAAPDALLQYALTLVDAIDADLARAGAVSGTAAAAPTAA